MQFAYFLAFFIASAMGTPVPSSSPRCVSLYPRKLDVAFYWARLDPQNTSGALIWERSCPELNVTAPGFFPTRETFLVVHGLQPGMFEARDRFALDGALDSVARLYVGHSVNFGVFLWDQFGNNDVLRFVRTEDQIYTGHGFNDMGYVVEGAKGRTHMRDAPTDRTVPDYLIANWRFHFPNGRDYPRVELVGHSLGTQVVLRTAYLLYAREFGIDKKPDAVTLLDAVMSPGRKMHFEDSPCGWTVSLNMGCMARVLNLNFSVPIRYFKSSFINYCIFSAREDVDLVEYTAFAVAKFHMFGRHPLHSCWDSRLLGSVKHLNKYVDALAYQMTMQHTYIVPYYLLTKFFPPYICTVNRTAEGQTCAETHSISLSAAMADADVLAWSRPPSGHRGAKLCFHQFDEHAAGVAHHANHTAEDEETGPTMTLTPDDDLYFLKPCIGSST